MADVPLSRPVAPGERILFLDVLRGFAMFGVLIAYCMWSLGTVPEESWSATDRAIGDFVAFAVDGKFYTILAFLFGLGFSLQLSRASDDAAAVEVYMRRLAVLAAIGLLHALLLRNGDILLPYAMTGFLLVPFRRARDSVIGWVAVAAVIVAYGARVGWPALGEVPQRPHLESAPYLVENAAWVRFWYQTAIFTWPINLTLFLLGLLAGRHRILPRLQQSPSRLWLIPGVGLALGTTLYAARMALLRSAWASAVAEQLLFMSQCWAMASAYAAALLLSLRTRFGVRVLKPLAAIGRLALTNYLMQAALIVPVCLAFDLFDRFTPAMSILLAVGLFTLIQLPASILWLQHFQFGPAEWLWRSLTYGRVAPARGAAATMM